MSVVISGSGAVCGYGASMRALAEGLASGTRRFSPMAALDSVRATPALVCAVSEIASRAGESRSAALALVAAREALAALGPEERADTAVILGGTTGGMDKTEACVLEPPFAGIGGFDADTAAGHPISQATRAVAESFGLRGARATVVSACSSGLNAVIWAKRWLEAGFAERVLAIGTDGLCRLTVTGFASLGAIDPDGARPFQRERKGITIGEGAAAFLVEREADAARAGRKGRARLLGGAVIGEAHHVTQPDPSGEGARRAMQQALSDAALAPTDIDAISAHGTATPQNDAMEAKAIAELFGANVPVSSQKSQLGHTLGAAGAIELAACLIMLDEQRVFPTYGLHADNLDPACGGVHHVMGAPIDRPLRRILKNSFAFGGQNSVLIVGSP